MSTKTSFSWKRKNVANLRPASFVESEDDEPYVEDWRSLSKKIKHGVLEDRITKSTRLKNEGIALAELQRQSIIILKCHFEVEEKKERK